MFTFISWLLFILFVQIIVAIKARGTVTRGTARKFYPPLKKIDKTQVFLYKISWMFPFSYSDIERSQMTKAQGQNRFSGHRQSVCQSLAFPIIRYVSLHF